MAGHRFQARGEVDHGAEDGDLHLIGGADFSGDGAAAGDADADA
jgi:hypothetical protein